jgi:putative membrane protein
MMYEGWGWGSGGWILFWAAVITAVVLAIRYLTGPRHTSAHPPGSGPVRAEGLLAERFARGEIDEDEFQRRMTLLREHR